MRTARRRRSSGGRGPRSQGRRLAQAQRALQALRSENVDALVVSRRERKRLLELVSSDLAYQHMIEQMSEGAVILTPDSTILYSNRRFAEMLQMPLERVMGSSAEEHIAPSAAASFQRMLAQAAKEPVRGEFSLKRADASRLPTLLSLTALRGYEVPALCMLAADLTAEQERRAELIAANKELEALNYSVSHDLRAPLRSIAGFSEALRRDYPDRLDERGRDYLRRIERATRRMSSLIDAMMHLSRTTLADLVREEVDLSELALSIGAELRESRPKRRVRLSVEPGMKAVADRALIEIALRCLLDNAWKFAARRRKAAIRVGTVEPSVYFVRDNGVGFEQAYVDKIFEPFQRLRVKNEFAGTGIGLSLVKRIVQRHGGRVFARSAPGKGATFYFTLGPGEVHHGGGKP